MPLYETRYQQKSSAKSRTPSSRSASSRTQSSIPVLTKTPSASKPTAKLPVKPDPPEPKPPPKEEEPDEYEDDFEEYDDDFESDDESSLSRVPSAPYSAAANRQEAIFQAELRGVKEAMTKENTTPRNGVGEAKKPEEVESPTAEPECFINFNSAKSRQRVKAASGKTRERSDKLLSMIQLDVVSYELLDMSPIPYESLMTAFGQTNAVQSATQTGDPLDESVQTEVVEVEHRSTQHPRVYFGADQDGGESESQVKFGKVGSLNRFLKSATQLMINILDEENVVRQKSSHGKDSADYLAFSEDVTYVQTTGYKFLQSMPVTLVAYAPDQTDLLLTVHRAKKGNGTSYLLFWNMNSPGSAKAVLVCESGVTCCSFPENRSNLVYAGTEDGTVCVWDITCDVPDIISLPEWLSEVEGCDNVLLPAFVTQQSSHMSRRALFLNIFS